MRQRDSEREAARVRSFPCLHRRPTAGLLERRRRSASKQQRRRKLSPVPPPSSTGASRTDGGVGGGGGGVGLHSGFHLGIALVVSTGMWIKVFYRASLKCLSRVASIFCDLPNGSLWAG